MIRLPSEVHRVVDTGLALLTRELGYALIKADVNPELTAENLLVYRNDRAEKQLEICADDSYFHCEIRRLLHGTPAPYTDSDSCIGFEALATLESNGTHDHMAYFAGGSNRMKGVLATTVSLFNRHREFLSTNAWVDTRRLSDIRDAGIERILKRPLSKEHEKRETFYDRMKRAVTEFLLPQGYRLAFDNKNLPSYHGRRRPDCVSFEKGETLVEVFQEDWRDAYYMYHVQVQGMTVASIDDTDGRSNDERVSEAISKLKAALSREGLFYDMGKGCSYLVRLAFSDDGAHAMDEFVTHGIEDKHLVFALSDLAFEVGLELPGEADQANDRDVQQALQGVVGIGRDPVAAAYAGP